ncbi:hypothetical protein WJX81_002216 [Elliptochloris bilobata]|uniref:Uncharacterized protein n=1 Tax=Elliptochloris bilobata TaxID=381761 RepID=A0AAW1SA66_9CHLO
MLWFGSPLPDSLAAEAAQGCAEALLTVFLVDLVEGVGEGFAEQSASAYLVGLLRRHAATMLWARKTVGEHGEAAAALEFMLDGLQGDQGERVQDVMPTAVAAVDGRHARPCAHASAGPQGDGGPQDALVGHCRQLAERLAIPELCMLLD